MIVKVNINNILAKMQLFILLAYPNNITFKNIKIISVLNNYSLQNNVLECVVLYNNCEIPVILKIERRKKNLLHRILISIQ